MRREFMVKGVKYRACDYLLKPTRLEQFRNVWMHVLQSGHGENSEKDGANHTRKHSKKNKKDGNGAKGDKDGMSTQKKQRIQWSEAVPKKLLEVMNVDGLTRDCIASHLQKYRIYLKQLNDGTFKHSNPFMEELQMLEANRGIPFDADNFFEEIAKGEMSAPSSHLPLQSPEFANQPSVHTQSSSAGQFNQVAPSDHLPLQSPELVNQPSIQIPPSSVGLFNPVAREPHQLAGLLNSSSSWRNGVPPRFPDIGHIAGTFIGPTHTNSIMINQISGLVASSSRVPTFMNEYQNQMAGLMGTSAPMVGLSEQVAETQFNSGSSASSTVVPIGNSTLGSSSSIRPTFSSLQIGNPVMPTQMPNGGSATGNLREGGTPLISNLLVIK
uniref:Response regulatory domain-containing protein n=1 Tax=Setaria viridis TaxID=4556 RepID=A0A4U6VDJ0_SETVI|nr:hypothetical protein SEVIR_4G207300v2 [Setaria viridis]